MSTAAPYLISKIADPLFAAFIGTSAAALRIQREQKEKYPDQPNDWAYLAQKTVTLTQGYFNGYEEATATPKK